jgi:hypothetical protein
MPKGPPKPNGKPKAPPRPMTLPEEIRAAKTECADRKLKALDARQKLRQLRRHEAELRRRCISEIVTGLRWDGTGPVDSSIPRMTKTDAVKNYSEHPDYGALEVKLWNAEDMNDTAETYASIARSDLRSLIALAVLEDLPMVETIEFRLPQDAESLTSEKP